MIKYPQVSNLFFVVIMISLEIKTIILPAQYDRMAQNSNQRIVFPYVKRMLELPIIPLDLL